MSFRSFAAKRDHLLTRASARSTWSPRSSRPCDPTTMRSCRTPLTSHVTGRGLSLRATPALYNSRPSPSMRQPFTELLPAQPDRPVVQVAVAAVVLDPVQGRFLDDLHRLQVGQVDELVLPVVEAGDQLTGEGDFRSHRRRDLEAGLGQLDP